MQFTVDRSIGDQLLESILEHPEEWEVKPDLKEPTTHYHKSGVELWCYMTNSSVGFWSPTEAKGVVEFTQEEKKLLYKAIEERRSELRKERLQAAKQLVVDKLNEPNKRASRRTSTRVLQTSIMPLPLLIWGIVSVFILVTIVVLSILESICK